MEKNKYLKEINIFKNQIENMQILSDENQKENIELQSKINKQNQLIDKLNLDIFQVKKDSDKLKDIIKKHQRENEKLKKNLDILIDEKNNEIQEKNEIQNELLLSKENINKKYKRKYI